MDLAVCQAFGLGYAEVRALPLAVYAVALEAVTARTEPAASGEGSVWPN